MSYERLSFIDEVTEVIKEDKAGGDVVCMDFSKIFDKVPFGRLNQKIKVHKINNELVTGKFARIVSGLEAISYNEWLDKLRLFSLLN